jgi:hypothetical protein
MTPERRQFIGFLAIFVLAHVAVQATLYAIGMGWVIRLAVNLATTALVVLLAFLFWRRRFEKHPFTRWSRGQCLACGYPRPAEPHPTTRCSECGEALEPPTA